MAVVVWRKRNRIGRQGIENYDDFARYHENVFEPFEITQINSGEGMLLFNDPLPFTSTDDNESLVDNGELYTDKRVNDSMSEPTYVEIGNACDSLNNPGKYLDVSNKTSTNAYDSLNIPGKYLDVSNKTSTNAYDSMSEPSYVDIAKDRLGNDGLSNHHKTSTNAYDSMNEPTYDEIGRRVSFRYTN